MARVPSYSDIKAALPASLRGLQKDYFTYRVEFLPLAGSTAETRDTTIQADSDFLIVALTGIVTNTDNVTFISVTAAPFLVRFIDTGSGRVLSDGDEHFSGTIGTPLEPYYLTWPKKIRAGSSLQTRLQNLDTVGRNVRIFFKGFKIFAIPES